MAECMEISMRSDVLTEFLEVAFHSILYTRNIYPSQIFNLQKKYQIPVRISKHPKVNEYLNECLKTIKYLLEFDSVKQVALAILNDDELVEKYVFDLELKKNVDFDEYLVTVEEMFRQYLLKLVVVDACLDEIPENCTFAIQITTNEQCYVRLNEAVNYAHFPWVEAETLQRSQEHHRILPVKSAECTLFKLNVYIER